MRRYEILYVIVHDRKEQAHRDCLALLYSGSVKLSMYIREENTATRSYFAPNFNFYTIIDLWVAYFNFREYEPEKRV